jgi:hypothetical protein
VGFGIERRAHSRKAKGGLRALIGRAPDAREVGDRLVRIAKRMLKGAVTDASAKRITLALHPAASPVRIVVLPDGDLEIRAETSAVGPGYHADVLARLAPILDELDYVWDGDEPEPRAAMAAWFAAELARGATRIGMPADRSFKVDAAVQTALGPRDRAWCDAVLADPLRAADAFPWWSAEAGERERSRALCAMWHQVAWRDPIDSDERTLMERVDSDLRAARKLNPALELPWAAWAELLDWLGEDEARITELRARAGETTATIGYRRYPMDIELSGGWSLELSGAFVGAWEDDGARYWATDGDRVIEFTSLTANTDQDSQQLLDIAPEAHAVIERVVEERRCGRAEAYDEGDVHIVHGLMTAAPEIAILTCKSTLADEPWALATWRSLRNG